jgi:pleuromutilin/lincosamide/streptogramin A transport system ATP-binding/permease protein
MNAINIQKLKYSIGGRELLNIENLQVKAGKRIGLVGKNGSGKTTLFRILLNKLKPDVGQFSVNGRIAMLPQLKLTTTHKSGGEISQDYIVRILNERPGILLADEPTTNLDTSHVQWVEKKLKEFQGTILLVSHDRTLLDEVCDTIWELEDSEITEYSGNYSAYVAQKENEKKHQQKEYEKYQQKKEQLENAIGHKERQAQRATKAPKNLTSSEARDASGVNPHTQKIQKGLHQNRKALETRLEKLEEVEKPEENTSLKMTLPNERSFKNKVIVRAEKMAGDIGEKKLWSPATFFLKGGDKVGIIGPNGSGKTTLLKKILDKNDSDVYLSPAVKVGYFSQNMDVLDTDNTIIENVKKESKQSETLIRIVLARLGFTNDDVYKKIHVLSGGERVKVALAKIFVSDSNTLVLDEPTNYLDIYALEALEELLKEYEGTILFVSHDRQFISSIATKIIAFKEGKLEFFEGSYTEYRNRGNQANRDLTAEKLMKVEMQITSILSELGNPMIEKVDKEILENKFQELLQQKRELDQS